MKRSLLALLAVSGMGLLVSGKALAQPSLVPDHDADILYRLTGAAADQIPGGAPDGVRLQWDAAGQRLRAEPVGRAAYTITDLRRRITDVVFNGQNAVLELPIRGGDPQALIAGNDVHFTRKGTSRVLGMECTDWAVQSRKLDVTGCVTADGLVLRAQGVFSGQQGTATAVSVSRASVPAAAFQLPEGAARMALPTFR